MRLILDHPSSWFTFWAFAIEADVHLLLLLLDLHGPFAEFACQQETVRQSSTLPIIIGSLAA